MLGFKNAIPDFHSSTRPDGTFDSAGFPACFARAEALGFDSLWTREQVIGSMPHLAPIEPMSYASACTDRLRIGCIAFISSLNQLSRGRLKVGLATDG